MKSHSLHPQVERKLRQIILTDLISDYYGNLYKSHLELTLNWLRLLMSELHLPKNDQKILLSSVYGYHWGCGNLFNLSHSHPSKPLEHKPGCFSLAAVKFERFLNYHFSKQYSQSELLEITQLLENQAEKTRWDEKESLLDEAVWIAWYELYLDNQVHSSSKKLSRVLAKLSDEMFQKKSTQFKHDAAKQAMQSLSE
jgi:hypothetical protein